MSLTWYWCDEDTKQPKHLGVHGTLQNLPALISSAWYVFVPPRNGSIKDSSGIMDLTTGPSMSGADI